MSAWYTSWLPSLPQINFPLPSGIQGRFVSFLLKKSLGHLLKPGQLDIHQIDSQIGSGFVQVKDLQLDNEAINELIAGLPLKLHSGSISSIIARIPWPNPLTSTVGFSLHSLHLTFCLLPTTANVSPQPNVNLADSVASIAESFLHNELSPREKATLHESFHPDLASSVASHANDGSSNIPGSIDPFLSMEDDEYHLDDDDPAGVSIFASLFERLLSRFEFDAADIKLTLIHPGHSSFSISIPEFRYCRELADNTGNTDDSGSSLGSTGTVSISGITMTTRNLRSRIHLPPSPLTPSTLSPVSPTIPSSSFVPPPRSTSPASSSSSINEDTQFLMSQSIACLPPRQPSPPSSEASSLYHSAVSAAPTPVDRFHQSAERRTPSPGGRDQVETNSLPGSSRNITPEGQTATKRNSEPLEETIVSFGAEPIIIRLTTPPVSLPQASPSEPTPSPSSHGDKTRVKASEKLHLSISTGVLSCALHAWHVRNLLDMLNASASHHMPQVTSVLTSDAKTPQASSDPTISMFAGIEGNMKVCGVVLVLWSLDQGDRTGQMSIPSANESLSSFFVHPLVPPQLSHGYVRVHVDGLSLFLNMSASAPLANTTKPEKHDGAKIHSRAHNSASTTKSLVLSLTDISIVAIHAVPTPSESTTLYASPILITDPLLPSQYFPTHLHPDAATFISGETRSRAYPQLPTFDVTDWTDERHRRNGMKISMWRSRVKPMPGRRGTGDGQPKARPQADLSPRSPRDAEHSEQLISRESNTPAIVLNAESSSNTGKKNDDTFTQRLDLKTVPLHIFVDLGMALEPGGLLAFLDPIIGFGGKESMTSERTGRDEESSSESTSEEAHTPPAAPGVVSTREREKERRRLERLVLKDLDLDFDYRKKDPSKRSRKPRSQRYKNKGTNSSSSINIPMIRLQIRTPSPSPHLRRSGALVFDLHDVVLSTKAKKSLARFTQRDLPPPSSVLLSAECRRILIGCSPAGDGKATAVTSIGPLSLAQELSESTQHVSELGKGTSQTLRPCITISRSNRLAGAQFSEPESSTTALALSVDIPSVNVQLSKVLLDHIQYWADDVTQLVEGTFSSGGGESERADSRDTSLIGSRYFARSRRSDSDSGSRQNSTHQPPLGNETVVKVVISEASIRLMVPRGSDTGSATIRPVDIFASDVDVLMEMKPAGKDQTVLTLGVMGLNLVDSASEGTMTQIISLTTARSLSSSHKSILKLRFISLIVPETTVKESRVKMTLQGFTFNMTPDLSLPTDIARFFDAPPGTFESVIPSERTRISLKIVDGSIRASTPGHPGAAVFFVGEMDFSTDIVGDSQENSFHVSVPALSLLFLDDLDADDIRAQAPKAAIIPQGISHWKTAGYALLSEVVDMDLGFRSTRLAEFPDTEVIVNQIQLRLHLCADTMTSFTSFAAILSAALSPAREQPPVERKHPAVITEQPTPQTAVMASVDEHAFRTVPEVGTAPDMINDDLPTNLDYLDESFGTAAGLRELRDDDLDEFDIEDVETSPIHLSPGTQQAGIISRVGGETIKMLDPEGIHIVENYYETLTPDSSDGSKEYGETTLSIRVHDCDVTVLLYDGYDWAKTRKTIENEVKEMRRRLAKIRQLVATGQTQDPSIDETSALLFNSVYIGLEQDVDDLDRGDLIAAIDEELNDELETTSQSSWQSLKPPSAGKPPTHSIRLHGKRLTRSRGPSIEFRLSGTDAEIDHYRPDETFLSRTFATIRDVEILDHIKTSTWQKFLTELRTDSRGNIRETDSNMVRVELRSVRPVPGHPSEEARLRAKILPLRLYVDQDALDFLKKFFSFEDPHAAPPSNKESSEGEIYFQLAEIFPVDLKLDYKPRRVDYRALREGRTIELMNFFHFDGAEMTLRHITLSGITGWPRLFELLNDLWTPDVKATQLMEVISGVSPIRSVVNVGSGFADLVLLPIAQYKKDGRIVRGVQKGTTAFVKSTAMEAIKLGARLATGTQVILEQAEGILGGQFQHPITAEAVQVSSHGGEIIEQRGDEEETVDLISRYAEQPIDIREGVQTAYRSLQRNFSSAAQTILAVPMEVYEKSGNEGPVRAVVRAVPIAVLKPMIGVSEAVGKTLLGFHNSLDPDIRHETEAKYKHR